MTRTLARRLAIAGGTLGIALACAGTASAAAAPATPAQAAVVGTGVPATPPCPPDHHVGLVGDILIDLGHILAVVL